MDEPALRSNKPSDEGSWVWASRHLLEMITDIANETNQAPAVRSVYLALTQFVRDGVAVVEIPRAKLFAVAGVGYTTGDAALKILVRAGAVTTERVRHNGLDTGLRIRILSVLGKRAPVPVGGADKPEEGIKREMIEMRERTTAKAVRPRAVPMPFPKSAEEVQDVAQGAGFYPEIGAAFWNMMTANDWKIRGRQVVDWKAALVAWCHADAKRSGNLKLDACTNPQFWEYVRANEYSEETATEFIRLLKKNGWRLKNCLTGRLEPVQDYRAAFKAFVESDLNQELERIGNR